MAAIFRREFSSYFTSPIGYIYLTVFYFFSGMFFNSVAVSYTHLDVYKRQPRLRL